METGSDPPSPHVLLCPECECEQRDETALFRHLTEAHPAVILGLPPKAPKKPKSPDARKKLTWKEEAKREMERADERRGAKRKGDAPAKAAPAKAPPAKTAPTKAAPAPNPAAPAAPRAPAAPAPAPPAPAEPARCTGEHQWAPSGTSQFLQFEKCTACGFRRMLPRARPGPDPEREAAEARAALLRRERGWKG